MDYYKILGVERNATESEIKQAYRRMAAKHHPDRGGSTEAFQNIEEAYRNLSDPQRRHAHDNPNQGFHFQFGGGNPFDVFGDIFNQFNRGNRQQQRMYTVTVFVTLEKVATGETQDIHIQTPAGSKLFTINVPQGIEDGQRVNYENLMPDGVLQIMFRVHKHDRFERRGLDLYSTEPISVFDLILGTTISVTTIHGKTLDIVVPPRTTPNSSFRVPNHGLETPIARGDQFVLISPVIPDMISQELLTALKREQANKQK